jgi:hypothetical protein
MRAALPRSHDIAAFWEASQAVIWLRDLLQQQRFVIVEERTGSCFLSEVE